MTGQAPDSIAATDVTCRLCGGPVTFVFHKFVIGKYKVSYFRCNDCKSQQTEKPYWLNEAYADTARMLDTGAAQRVLDCLVFTHIVVRQFGFRTTLDYGGGAGLLCRLLRDIGHDAYWYDAYTAPGYAAGFPGTPENHYDLVTSFEVVEHFPDPAIDWDPLFRGDPDAVLVMTELFRDQGPDWWYLAPEEGQHVFFYSSEAIVRIGRRYRYHSLICPRFVLFSRRPPTVLQKLILQKLLRPRIVRWLRPLVLARRTGADARDCALLEGRMRKAQGNSGPAGIPERIDPAP